MNWKKIEESISDFYNPENDEVTKAHIADTNKPKLTLRNINNLKHLRKAKELEKEQKLEKLSKIYGKNDNSGGGF